MNDFRNSYRCKVDSVHMTNILYERIKSYLPETFKEHRLVGLNERLRFLRYDPGQKFEGHMGKKISIVFNINFDL